MNEIEPIDANKAYERTEVYKRTQGIKAPLFGGRKWRLEVGLDSPEAEAWAFAVIKEKLLLMVLSFIVGYWVAVVM